MAGVFLKPRISPLLVDRIRALLGMREDEEDIHEGLKALADEEGTITQEQYQRQRVGPELQAEASSPEAVR